MAIVLSMHEIMKVSTNCEGYIAVLMLIIPMVASQLPQLSTIPKMLGECAAISILMLGNTDKPDTKGLVPSSLVAIAMKMDQYSLYYTTQAPSVQIMNAVVTCQSLAVHVPRYSTTSVLVDYTCSGVACEQLPDNLQSVSYVHLFSFICENTTNVWVPGSINRTTTNSISNPVTSLYGLCSLCTNNSTLISITRFDSVTGCVGKF